jgi:hypothetical protein
MRSLDEVIKTSPERSPFCNGTEGHDWMYRWCDRCQHPVEKAWQAYNDGKRKTQLKGYEGGCPLLMAALVGHTPAEWLEQEEGLDRYHCIEFRGPDEGGGDSAPRPKPEPTDMEGLFPRPERRVRMLQQPEPSRELVPA